MKVSKAAGIWILGDQTGDNLNVHAFTNFSDKSYRTRVAMSPRSTGLRYLVIQTKKNIGCHIRHARSIGIIT